MSLAVVLVPGADVSRLLNQSGIRVDSDGAVNPIYIWFTDMRTDVKTCEVRLLDRQNRFKLSLPVSTVIEILIDGGRVYYNSKLLGNRPDLCPNCYRNTSRDSNTGRCLICDSVWRPPGRSLTTEVGR